MSAAELAILITLKDQASKGLAGIGDALGSGIGKAAKIGAAAIAGIAVAAGAASVLSLKSFLSFEQGMNEVFTLIPGAGQEAFDDLTKQTKSFAKDFGVLPDKVIPALYQALSAGVPRDNVFEFLEVAQKAAVGGVTELETAVDGISSVVNAYGADVLDAGRASDLMFTAVRLGKTTFDELSQSLFQVTPTAAALGVNFGDVTAALAAMTAQGVPTSVATTQLRQLFVELSKEGTATSKVFQDMAGKSFKDFVAAGGDTQQALQLLEQYAAEAGLSISDLFGSVEAGNAALALTGQGTDAFTSALAEMRTSAGATDEAYAQMQTGLNRSIARIQAAFAVLKIEVGSRLAPVLAALLTLIIAKGIPAVAQLAKLLEGPLTKGFATARDTVKTFVQAIQGDWTDDTRILGLHRAVGLVGSAIHGLVDAFNQGGVLGLFRELGSLAVTAFQGVNWTSVGQTILDGIAGVTGLVFDAGTWLLGMMTGVDWNSTARTIGQSILDGLATAGGWLFDAGAWILSAAIGVDWNAIARTIGQSILDGLATAGEMVWDVAAWLAGLMVDTDWAGVASTIWGGILGALKALATVGTDIVAFVAEALVGVAWVTVAETILKGIIDNFNTITGWGQQFVDWMDSSLDGVSWSTVAETISTGISDALALVDWTAVGTAISGAFASIKENNPHVETLALKLTEVAEAADPLVTIIRDNLNVALRDAKQLFQDVSNTIAESEYDDLITAAGRLAAIFGGALLVAVTVISFWLEGLGKLWGTILPPILNAFIWLLEDLAEGFNQVYDTIAEIVGGVQGLIQNDWGQTWDDAKQVVSDAKDGIIGFVDDLWTGIRDKVVEVYTTVMEWFRATKDDTVRIVGEMTDGIITWLEGLPGRAVTAIGDLSGALWQAGKDLVSGFAKGIVAGITEFDPVGTLKGLGSDAISAITGFGQSPWPAMIAAGHDAINGLRRGIEEATPVAIEQAARAAQGVIAVIEQRVRGSISVIAAAVADVGAALSIDWGFLFGNIDQAAEDAGVRMMEAVAGFITSIEDIASGARAEALQEKIANLFNIRAALLELNEIGAAEIVGNQLAAMEAELAAVGAIAGTAVVQGMAEAIASEQSAEDLKQAVGEAAEALREGIDRALDIMDGSAVAGAKKAMENAQAVLQFAIANQWPEAQIAALEEMRDKTANEYVTILGELGNAAAAGLVSQEVMEEWGMAAETLFQIPLDKLAELLPQMQDGGASIVDELALGVGAGAASLEDALGILRQMHEHSIDDLVGTTGVGVDSIIAELETLEGKLMGDLAQAFITGLDPDGVNLINANIDAIRALLAALNADIAATTAELIYMGTVSGSGPGTTMMSGAPVGGGSVPGSGAGEGGQALPPIIVENHVHLAEYEFRDVVTRQITNAGRGVM